MRHIHETVSALLGPWQDTKETDYSRGGLAGRCLGPLADLDLPNLPWETAPAARRTGVSPVAPDQSPGPAKKTGETPVLHAREAVCVKRSGTRCVLALPFKDFIGRPVRLYAKRCRARNALKRLVSVGRASKSRREWDLGWQLLERGIAVAPPLLWAEWRWPPGRRAGMMSENYLVTLGLENAVSFRVVWREAAASPGERHFWLERLGRFVRQTHEAGFAHDDLSIDHIFLGQDAEKRASETPRFYLIDLDGGRLAARVGPYRRAHNFFQFFRSMPRKSFGPEERRVFYAAYSEGAWDDAHIRAVQRMVELIAGWKRFARVFRPGKWL